MEVGSGWLPTPAVLPEIFDLYWLALVPRLNRIWHKYVGVGRDVLLMASKLSLKNIGETQVTNDATGSPSSRNVHSGETNRLHRSPTVVAPELSQRVQDNCGGGREGCHSPATDMIEKSSDHLPGSPFYAHYTLKASFTLSPAMLTGSKRRTLTTDDLMRRQEVGPRKRLKPIRDEDEDSLRDFDGLASAEDSQSDGLSAPDEGEDSEDSQPEIPVSNAEEDGTIPSRFSSKPRQGTVAKETTVSPHASSPPPPTFAGMGVSSSLISAMNKMSIRAPTEIQAACIPPLLDGMYFTHSVPRPQR